VVEWHQYVCPKVNKSLAEKIAEKRRWSHMHLS